MESTLRRFCKVPKVRGPGLQLFPNTKDIGTGMGEIGMWAFSSGARRNDQQAFPVGDDIEELGIGIPEHFVRHFDTRQATGT
ncbi:unnamed protein product [Sphagnum jensenii]|uniref:Uncharacterized protein n=1 Tax=Sphagnum jensenii TaxID=128206 RepID=A0ABP1B9K1_9BRYO